MITYKGKQVLVLNSNCNLGDAAVLSNIWGSSDWTFRNSYKYNIFCCSKSSLKAKITSLKSPLTAGSVLYFSSSSSYPRFKLTDSGFKRCIKVDKADFVVLGELSYQQMDNTYLFEDEEYYYLVDYDRMYFSYRTDKQKITSFKNNPEKYIKDHHLYYGSNITLVYKGNICFGNSNTEDLERIMDGTFKKIIYDSDLDAAVNQNFEVLDKEALTSICDMLDSPDNTTRGVGLKVLLGYNVQATPLTVRTILGLRSHLSGCNEWHGVGVQQVLSSIGWKGFGQFPNQLYNILPSPEDAKKYSEEDKNLCKDVYRRAVDCFMKNQIESIERTKILSTFDWEINYTVNEK